jgi:hypothetical protein
LCLPTALSFPERFLDGRVLVIVSCLACWLTCANTQLTPE